jgi:hypothetical protein
MSKMEGEVAIKANEAGHEQSDLRLHGSSVPCMNLLVSCYSGGLGHARQRHFFSYACDDCFIGCFLSFLVFFLVSHATVLLSGSKAVQCNLNLRIFRLRHSCRCLRSFLGATPAMRHALMLAELDCRLIRSVAHTTSIPTRRWL